MVPDFEPDRQPIIALVGPTATGKTAVAVRLANALNGEVISADSQAVYRGMDIGTAKPTAQEQREAAFHLIDVAEIGEAFNVSRFKHMAEGALADIVGRGRTPILAGGTGLYVRALLEDYGLTETPPDLVIRDRLNGEAEMYGTRALYDRLVKADEVAAARIHPNDRVRIVRALEVFERTGVPISVQQARDAQMRKPRPSRKFGLLCERELLYQRIETRVDKMMHDGLLQEVQELLSKCIAPLPASLQSLGYKEIIAHLMGDCDLDAAILAIKHNTKRFAKRQITWFRADHEITWIDTTGLTVDQVAEQIVAGIP